MPCNEITPTLSIKPQALLPSILTACVHLLHTSLGITIRNKNMSDYDEPIDNDEIADPVDAGDDEEGEEGEEASAEVSD
jgi:hypothetical protein